MRSTSRIHARGASMVEYMIILGVVALASLTAFNAFGTDARALAAKEGACVQSFACNGGPGYDGLAAGSDRPPTGDAPPPGNVGDARLGPSGAWADASSHRKLARWRIALVIS